MQITINLPEQIYLNVSNLAAKTRRRVDEIIVEKIEQEFALDGESLAAQIATVEDAEIIRLASAQMPPKQDRRVSFLLQKQGAQDLTVKETRELDDLIKLNRMITIQKAFALREATRRNLNVEN